MNDIALVFDLLTHEFRFANEDIMILADKETGLEHFPNLRHYDATSASIVAALKWLAIDAQPGDRLWFSFSGHGVQLQDQDGDEFDGMDEALLGSDMVNIVDDDILAILEKIPPGARLTGLIDACHSGTSKF